MIATHPVGLPVERHMAVTDDRLRLALKRYPRPGATPVLLVHGLAQNSCSFDLPVPGHNLAAYLFLRGFDVWLANLRSHGRDGFVSESHAGWDWCIDDHALKDLPALLSRVVEETGTRPFYIGHSMGGMALYMYLGGAYLGAEAPAADAAARVAVRVRGSADQARRRNAELAGAITLGSPVLLKWRHRLGALRSMARLLDGRALMSLVSGQPWLRALLLALGRAPTAELAQELVSEEGAGLGVLPYVSLRRLLYWPVGQATKIVSHHHLWNPDNMTPELLQAAVRKSIEHCCGRVLVQFLDWIAHGAFREFPAPGARDLHDYAAALPLVTAPLLMVTGELDRFTDLEVLHEEGYLRMGAADKSLVVLPDTGHADILYGRHMPGALFPMLVAWMRKRV